MPEKSPQPQLSQIVLLSSAITLLLIVGVLFIAREAMVAFILKDVNVQTGSSRAEPETVGTEPLVEMIAKTNPAIVSIVITKDVPIYEQYYETFESWGAFSIPRIRKNGTKEEEVGGGSGFIVSNDGMIVTNNHVVSDENARYSILLTTGVSYTVDVLARDSQLDIAILKINQPLEAPLTYVSFGDSTKLSLGQTVVAIGNALGEFQNSVSVGVVSGLSRSIVASDEWGRSERLDQVIQTDAAINPGNSGGPLLNLQGEVVGVNVATSRGADNIGFALPAQAVEQVVDSVRMHGVIVRPFIGIRYVVVTPRLQKANNLSIDYGILIIRGQSDAELAVQPGSPADKAGLLEYDIVLSLDGEELRNKDLVSLLRTKTVGQVVTLKVLSKGEEKTVNVTLEKTL